MSNAKDYIAQWYEVREEFGISDAIHIFFHNLSSGNNEFQEFRHRDMDGIGMIARSLEDMGYQHSALPVSRDPQEPGIFSVWKKQRKLQSERLPKTVQWQSFQSGIQAEATMPQIGIIEPDLLEHLKATSAIRGVSLASFILASLNKAAFEQLLQPGSTACWFYPVNIRDQQSGQNDRGNRSSGFYLPVTENSTAESIHQQVRERLRTQQHWWLWKQAHIGRLIGKRGVRWIYQKLSRSQFYLGSYSFLGDWSMKDHPQLVLGVCGPGSENYPIATGITESNNHLSLALKFHPSICKNDSSTQACLQRWIDILKEDSGYE